MFLCFFSPLASCYYLNACCYTCILSYYLKLFHMHIYIFCCMWLYSGKTYTMVGSHNDPGLMVLSFRTIFDQIKKDDSSDTFEVSCSYLEVYNEVMCNIFVLIILKYQSFQYKGHACEAFVGFLKSRLSMICLRNPRVTWSFVRIRSMA
jgi:hypothetical protein